MPGEHVAEAPRQDQKAAQWNLECGRSITRSTWKRTGDSPGLLDWHLRWPCRPQRVLVYYCLPKISVLLRRNFQQNLLPADSDMILQTGMTTVCPAAFLEEWFERENTKYIVRFLPNHRFRSTQLAAASGAGKRTASKVGWCPWLRFRAHETGPPPASYTLCTYKSLHRHIIAPVKL